MPKLARSIALSTACAFSIAIGAAIFSAHEVHAASFSLSWSSNSAVTQQKGPPCIGGPCTVTGRLSVSKFAGEAFTRSDVTNLEISLDDGGTVVTRSDADGFNILRSISGFVANDGASLTIKELLFSWGNGPVVTSFGCNAHNCRSGNFAQILFGADDLSGMTMPEPAIRGFGYGSAVEAQQSFLTAPIPVPPALPLLVTALGLMVIFSRRCSSRT